MTEYKNEEHGLWLIRHPTWIRILGWTTIPLITISALYVMAIPILEQRYDVTTIAACTGLGFGCLYLCYRAFTVFPFLRADIEVGEDGFTIYYPNGNESPYNWSDVSKTSYNPFVQVFSIYSNNGKRVLAITDQVTSYAKFVELSRCHVPGKT